MMMMNVVHEDLSEDSSVIQSTTIKTIRNLKSKNSYSNVLSSQDDYPNSNDNTNIPPQTPSQHEDDTNYKTDEVGRHKKVPSMPNSIIKNPMRKSANLKIQKLKSESIISSEEKQLNEGDYGVYGSISEQMNPIYNKDEANVTISNGKSSRNATGMGSSLSKVYNRGQSTQSNHTTDIIQSKEYIQVDLDFAIQYVLSKSKALKEKMENEGIHQASINQYITKNKFFMISYNYFLQNLITQKILSADFKNMNKKIFEKLEKFFFDRIDKCQETITIQQTYVKKSKAVYSALDKRIQELQKELANKNKIDI